MKTAAIPVCVLAIGVLSACIGAPDDDSSSEQESQEFALDADDWSLGSGGTREEGSSNERWRSPEEGDDQLGRTESPLVSTPAEAPDPGEMFIEEISTGGTGCPNEDSVSSLIVGNTFQISFNEMSLMNPSPDGRFVQNINCTAGIRLHIPQGWQFSVANINTRGYAYLDARVRARETSEYWFAGRRLEQSFRSQLVGPYDGDYTFTDRVPFESTVWSPCGRSAIFAINTSLNLNAASNRAGEAIFNAETLDGMFEKVLHFSWRRCEP